MLYWPNHNIPSFLLHNCDFATVTDHNVNICVFWCLRWPLRKGLFDPQRLKAAALKPQPWGAPEEAYWNWPRSSLRAEFWRKDSAVLSSWGLAALCSICTLTRKPRWASWQPQRNWKALHWLVRASGVARGEKIYLSHRISAQTMASVFSEQSFWRCLWKPDTPLVDHFKITVFMYLSNSHKRASSLQVFSSHTNTHT